MKGGKNRQPLIRQPRGRQHPVAGYTLIEVLIVLAVTALMFLVAANFINGKQEHTSFDEGLNEMASQIQDISEQVNDGKYSDVPLQCSFDGTTVTLNGSVDAQGSDTQCVFVGKVIRFIAGSVPYKYDVLSLTGGRIDPNVETPTLANIDPTVVPSLTINQTIDQELDVKDVAIVDSGGVCHKDTYYNFGFTQGLGAANGKGSYQTGSQTISLVYASVGIGGSDTLVNDQVATAQAVVLYLNDGTQTGTITIGTNNNQLSVSVQHLGTGTVVPVCPS